MRTKLRQLRKQKGVSQTFISNALGYSHPSGYSNIEHGRSKLTYEHAQVISDILGVGIDELSEDNEKKIFDSGLHKTTKNSA